MSQSDLCRLCVNVCKDSKSLYDDDGCATELYDITFKYFHPTILDMGQWRHLTGICLQCFHHICEFHSFQTSVLVAQLKLIEEVGEAVVKSEAIDISEDFQEPMVSRIVGVPTVKNELCDDGPSTSNNQLSYDISMTQNDVNVSLNAWHESNTFTEVHNYLQHTKKPDDFSPIVIDSEIDSETLLVPMVSIYQAVDPQEKKEPIDVAPNATDALYEETPMVETDDSSKENNNNSSPKGLAPFYQPAELPEDIDDLVAQWKPLLKCVLCPESCSKLSLLKAHFRLKHVKTNCYISCCGRKYSETHKIKKHVLKHIDTSSFKCDLCGHCFANGPNLKRHVFAKHLKFKVQNRAVTRRLQNLKFSQVADHLEPENYIEATDVAPNAVEEPGGKLNSTEIEVEATEVAPNAVERPFGKLNSTENEVEAEAICQDSAHKSKSTGWLGNLDELIGKWTPILKCELCPESCSKFSLLEDHFRQKHADEKCYISCCNRTFSTRSKIKQHVRQHVDPSLIKCIFCGKCFSNKANLKRHALTSHLLSTESGRGVSMPSAEGGTRYRRSNKWLGELDDLLVKWKPTLKCELCLCSETFSKFSLLEEHFRQNHADEKCYISCCDRKFSTKPKIEEHVLQHIDPNAFKCDLCGSCFTMWDALKRHLVSKHPEANKNYECIKCDKRFPTKQGLKIHFTSVHAKVIKRPGKGNAHVVARPVHKCSKCRRCFLNQKNLKKHMLAIHLKSKKQTTSTHAVAKRKLVQKSLMQMFSQSADNEATQDVKNPEDKPTKFEINELETNDVSKNNISLGGGVNIPSAEGGTRYRRSNKWLGELDDLLVKWRPTLKCELCPETFSKFSLMEEHFRQNHADEKCYISCCDRKFSAKPKIEEHVLQHIDPDAFKCDLCGSCFTMWDALKKHLVAKHPEANRNYVCVKCDKRFPTKQGLKIHFTVVHVTKLMRQRAKRADKGSAHVAARPGHKCNKCGKSFSDRHNLKRHILVLHLKSKKQKSISATTAAKRKLLHKNPFRKLSQTADNKEALKVNFLHASGAEFPVEKKEVQTDDNSSKMNISQGGGGGNIPSAESGTRYRRSNKWLGDLDELIVKWTPSLKCELCPETCSKFSLLEEHFRQDHPDDKCYISCCDRKFSTRPKIEEHVLQHINPNAFKCDLCGSCFTMWDTLKRHLVAQHPEVHHKNYECVKCDRRFPTKQGLKIHFTFVHAKLIRQRTKRADKGNAHVVARPLHKCNKCGKCFSYQQNLKRHILVIHQKPSAKTVAKRKLVQKTPTQSVITKKEKQEIIEPVEATSSKEDNDYRYSKICLGDLDDLIVQWKPLLNCELCPESCSKFSLLEEHFRQKHADSQCYISCCGRQRSQRHKLKEHALMHIDPAAFKCDLCGSSFTMRVNLRRHLDLQHPGVFQGKYECEKCDKTFSTQRGLKLHFTIVHSFKYDPDKALVDVKSVHKCKKCGKSFGKATALNKHLQLTHSPNPRHKCKTCGLSFKFFQQLLEHSTIHTGKDIYACMYCPRTYRLYTSMYKHRRKEHSQESGGKYYKMLM